MQDIVVIGGGGHAKVVISILKKLPDLRVIGYTDVQNKGAILDVPYLGPDSSVAKNGLERAVLAVGQLGLGHQREEIWRRLSPLIFSFPAIASPRAVVNEAVKLGEGTVVMDSAVINSGAVTGRGAILNTGSIIEHDVVLDDWVHIGPGATIAGGVKVGQYCMIGAGAIVIQGRTIAPECVVGAGTIVIRDLTEPGVYVGCPARRIR